VTKVEYYEFLGVSRDCNDQELKTAYRRLAMQYHPDRNPVIRKRKRSSSRPAKRTRYSPTRKSALPTIATGTRA
jgi:DnaJ-class molecular chaperone